MRTGDRRRHGPPSGLASCVGSALLTRSPVALSALRWIIPLGNLNPTGHVFPTDHLYFESVSPPSGSPPTPVVSPGNVVVAQAGGQTNSG